MATCMLFSSHRYTLEGRGVVLFSSHRYTLEGRGVVNCFGLLSHLPVEPAIRTGWDYAGGSTASCCDSLPIKREADEAAAEVGCKRCRLA